MMHHFREPTSGFTHLFAAALSAGGLLWLVSLTQDDTGRMITMLIYGLSMVLLYSASAAYHLIKGSWKVQNVLVRFDLVGIYLLIAGTYTPLCYHFLEGRWRWGMLGTVWTIALVGSIYVIFFHKRRKLNIPLTLSYVFMGCIGLFGFPRFLSMLPMGAVALILGGGLVYLVGTVIYTLNKPNLHRHFNAHDLWHIFVMGGSACFFVAILLFVAMV